MIKILLVTSDVDYGNSLKSILEQDGHEIICATSEAQALEKIKTAHPSLVILDVIAGQANGVDILEKIRQLDRGLGVMVVSEIKDKEAAQRAIESGAFNYLTRPLDIDLLKKSIHTWDAQVEIKQFSDVDILILDYDEQKIKEILALFSKRGYNIKVINNKNDAHDIIKGAFEFAFIRADLLGSDAVEILASYKQVFPELVVIVSVRAESPDELTDKISRLGHCRYIPSSIDTYRLSLIIYQAVSRSQEKKEVTKQESSGGYIFIVDDEASICESAARYLNEEGHKALAITNPKTVLDQVKSLRPAIVFLDIIMPNVDGMELLKKIKQIFPRTHVVMMTGLKDESVCREAIELGACDYIVKPFSLEQLKMTILMNTLGPP